MQNIFTVLPLILICFVWYSKCFKVNFYFQIHKIRHIWWHINVKAVDGFIPKNRCAHSLFAVDFSRRFPGSDTGARRGHTRLWSWGFIEIHYMVTRAWLDVVGWLILIFGSEFLTIYCTQSIYINPYVTSLHHPSIFYFTSSLCSISTPNFSLIKPDYIITEKRVSAPVAQSVSAPYL